MPTYNYARYISGAIESVLNQRFEDFELIVLDDCSTDNTQEVVGRFLCDKRVSFEKNEQNVGMVGNWNKCLSKARGEYIKFVFSDDMLASDDALGLMAGIMDSDPSVALVASARHVIDSESRIVGLASHFPPGFAADGTDIINRCLRRGTMLKNFIGEPTVVMFRRADSVRGFDERYQQLVDLEMWFHLLEKGRFAFLAQPLASFRVHTGQKSRANLLGLKYLDDEFRLLVEYSSKPYCRINFIRKLYRASEILYVIWKCGKNGIITREEASARIRARCSCLSFGCHYIAFKVLRRLLKFETNTEIDRKIYGAPGQNPFGL